MKLALELVGGPLDGIRLHTAHETITPGYRVELLVQGKGLWLSDGEWDGTDDVLKLRYAGRHGQLSKAPGVMCFECEQWEQFADAG